MELEESLVSQIIDLLKSTDTSNHTLVKAVLEIDATDYSNAVVSANIDKIVQLAEYVVKDPNLAKAFPI